ncbi:MAG: hypothetical protein HUU22_09640 [Phycisphaerae bacterium]|nr:hypothetical protein [Phycisphaerae bacterium]NUQ46284.1 hypothetical protein [Phycisphaerae bacterium]
MAVTILCPNLKCRKVLQVPEAVRGKQVRCGYCGSALLVPEARKKPEVTTASSEKTE